MKLIVIGCGNMGSAIIRSLSKRDKPLFEKIFVCDHSPQKIELIKETKAIFIKSLNNANIDNETVVLIAVKPQDIELVLKDLKGKLKKQSLVVSIAAGVSLKKLQDFSGHNKIVRVMPNTPAVIQKGATGWIASPSITTKQKKLIISMLDCAGLSVELEKEDLINSVTALSGSGPAYVFYFLEALTEGGLKLGLTEEDSLRLALQTVAGAAELAKSSTTLIDLKNLRTQVTSKGGTTERALASLESDDFKNIITKAMKAAYDRAQEF